jgi:succinate dehydrogenase/fumarate reductase flavoprotein subunit
MTRAICQGAVNRRGFIKGAVAGSGVNALAGVPLGAREAAAQSIPSETYDGVIVGSGMAGVCAALSAAEAGAKIVVLEKASRDWILNPRSSVGAAIPGGNETGRSGGAINIGPYETLFAQVRPDTMEEVLQELKRRSLNKIDLERTKFHLEQFPGDIQWLMELGLPSDKTQIGDPRGDYYWRGKLCRVRTVGAGTALIRFLISTAEKKNIRILWDHRGDSLLTGSKGGVIGIRVMTPEGLKDFMGRVVLATGGFEGNEEMLEKYVRPVMPYILPVYARWDDSETGIVRTGSPLNTGDGHRMAMDVRAQMLHMYMARCRGADKIGGSGFRRYMTVQAGISVNIHGQRVTDETNPDNLGVVNPLQPLGTVYVIFDEAIRRKFPDDYGRYPNREKLFEVAGTIGELAEKIGVDYTGLRKTIDEYNAALKPDGTAPTLPIPKKGASGMRIETPPFYATALRGGLNDTEGGMKINTRAQVIDLDGKPIPGLYGCGACTSGGSYFVVSEVGDVRTLYIIAGVHRLGGALTYGRVAGKETAGK